MNKIDKLLLPFFLSGEKVGIAVSGGADSMALLHLCVKISKNVVVLHINHQTRKECKEESLFIQKICNAYQIPFVELKAQNLSLEMPNFENEARKERYRLLLYYAEQHNITSILTAHHQDDLIENIFLKICRSSMNIFIPSKRSLDKNKKIWIYRPLLSVKKRDLELFLSQNKLVYKDDASNQNIKYLRNFLRVCIVPLFHQKIDFFYEKMNTLVHQRYEEVEFLKYYTAQRISQIFPQDEVYVEVFIKEHPYMQARILQQKIMEWTNISLTHKNMQQILNKIEQRKTSSIILWKYEDFILLKEKDKISFFCENQDKSLEKNTIIVHNKMIYQDSMRYNVELEKGSGLSYVIDDEIYLRSINEGEKFPWNQGHKSLMKILKDKKIPCSKRKNAKLIIKNEERVGILSEEFVYILPFHRVNKSHKEGLIFKLK